MTAELGETFTIAARGLSFFRPAGNSDLVSAVSITADGAGYTSAVTVVFTRTTGTESGDGATATATVSGGSITEIVITNPGGGYQSAPAISFDSNRWRQSFYRCYGNSYSNRY